MIFRPEIVVMKSSTEYGLRRPGCFFQLLGKVFFQVKPGPAVRQDHANLSRIITERVAISSASRCRKGFMARYKIQGDLPGILITISN